MQASESVVLLQSQGESGFEDRRCGCKFNMELMVEKKSETG
jgi:hypothetical protein